MVVWHCWICGEMTLAFYTDPWSHLCPDCQDDLAAEVWDTRVRLVEECQ